MTILLLHKNRTIKEDGPAMSRIYSDVLEYNIATRKRRRSYIAIKQQVDSINGQSLAPTSFSRVHDLPLITLRRVQLQRKSQCSYTQELTGSWSTRLLPTKVLSSLLCGKIG